jgi:hypothetical protein
VLPFAVRAAAVGPGPVGDLEVLAVRFDDGELVRTRRLSPDLWSRPEPVERPVSDVVDMSFVRDRGGVTLAVAGPDGLWLRQGDSPWLALARGPFQAVALRPSRGWRLRLAALSGGRVGYWAEDSAGTWVGHEVLCEG